MKNSGNRSCLSNTVIHHPFFCSVILTLINSESGSDYREGDIRLVGGVYSWEGRVEIYLYGEWGTVSYYHAHKRDAHVVCRQLGYDTRCENTSINQFL